MRVEPVTRLVGHIAVPGDKSISHRSVLLGAISDGETRITGFGRSADTEATIEAVRALGITVYEHGEDTLHVFGQGLRGLVAPGRPIDCANSGTLVRLLSGILAGQQGQQFELTGDTSLSSRPMKRITEPLGRMGAGVETDGHLPLGIEGRSLRSITYELPVASAQVKSAILLAGLYAKGDTTVVEPQPTRDHTELMLEAAGVTITRREKSVTIQPADRLEPVDIEVPGDFSSAAPFIVAATLVPGSELHIHGVNLNSRRTGLLTILERMGGRVTAYNRRRVGGERVGDLEVRSAELVATTVLADEVPLAIDELPLFALAASCAHGNSRLRGAEELRAKESDRVEATVDALRSLGQHVFATEDGFRIRGVPTRPRGGKIESRGDHRIAMLGAIAGLDSQDGVEIDDPDCVAVSFPGFFELLSQLRTESTDS
jgi:3-phosphoshikimate 1-carboxyvinyltransferase